MEILIFSDGGARGNPGPAGAGVVICDAKGKVLEKHKKSLGVMTNNQAEYSALILGLEKAKKLKPKKIRCYLDSELLVEQLNQNYKVKNAGLKPLFEEARAKVLEFPSVTFFHIPREKNEEADRLANLAMDKMSA